MQRLSSLLFFLLTIAIVSFSLSSPVFAAGAMCSDGVINTALGCIDISGIEVYEKIITWAIGIAGAVTFILIFLSAFQITTARGDPKRVKAGQELLTAALSGFFLIVFAVVVLNLLGVKVLNLGGIGFSISRFSYP